MKKINPVFDLSALDSIQLEGALYRKKTKGSPNPDIVKNEIEKWKNKLELIEKELNETNIKK